MLSISGFWALTHPQRMDSLLTWKGCKSQASKNLRAPLKTSRVALKSSKLAPMLKPTLMLCGALCFSSGARACLWDSDTLETEAKGVLTAIKAISGRFERNPPLYYEMRLQRVSAQIDQTPRDFNLDDDAAV